jgi:hypothetical protein
MIREENYQDSSNNYTTTEYKNTEDALYNDDDEQDLNSFMDQVFLYTYKCDKFKDKCIGICPRFLCGNNSLT